MFNMMAAAFGNGPSQPISTATHSLFSNLQSSQNKLMFNLSNILTDVKLTLVRNLMIRTCFDKYF